MARRKMVVRSREEKNIFFLAWRRKYSRWLWQKSKMDEADVQTGCAMGIVGLKPGTNSSRMRQRRS
jgi:hypothetical protein